MIRFLALIIPLCALSLSVAGTPEKFLYVDLQPKANQKLTNSFGSGQEGNNLGELPKGEQTFEKVKFKIDEGLIQLGSRRLREEKPDKVAGIKIAQKFSKLHILHSTCFGSGEDVPDGIQIGEYKVHYDDGSTHTIPFVYGQDVRDWWFSEDSKGVTHSKVAWTGDNEVAKTSGRRIRLYLTTWDNPRPQRTVTAIDYVKINDTVAAPFCVAITLQQE